MRILFIADGRSPTARNWINSFLESGDQVHLISTYPCQGDEALASFDIVPVGLSGLKFQPGKTSSNNQTRQGIWGARAVGLRTRIRQWVGPFTVTRAAKQLSLLMDQIQPDLVHAMRIPFEGMLAARARPQAPFMVSVWGNDFTLHAKSNPWMSNLTRHTLATISALHTDCQRDLRLAISWGFDSSKASLVVPGGGGIQAGIFFPPEHVPLDEQNNQRRFTVVNPRGVRAYIRSDVFFQAIPLVLAEQPKARFFCPTMAGDSQAEQWVQELGIGTNTFLLPYLTRQEMANLLRSASIVVSPSLHDGTPNSILEAMACGCFPVVGDLESLREWIKDGENGMLVNVNDPQALAQAILLAMNSQALLDRANQINLKLIEEKARYEVVMKKVKKFYKDLIEAF